MWVTLVSHVKTAEPIEVRLGADSGGPKEPCIRWGRDPHGKGQLWGSIEKLLVTAALYTSKI